MTMKKEEAKKEICKVFEPAFANYIITALEEGATEDLLNGTQALPSVTPTRKKGKWVKHEGHHSTYYDCSLCGCFAPCTKTTDGFIWKLSNYCPDCGAEMKRKEEHMYQICPGDDEEA
jgi:hypothetical protein